MMAFLEVSLYYKIGSEELFMGLKVNQQAMMNYVGCAFMIVFDILVNLEF